MTAIVYNDVILRDCETKAFDQIVELDESGTDLLLSRFRVRVASTVVAVAATGVPAFGAHTPMGSTAVQRANDIYNRLKEPRKDFWMIVDNGVTNEITGSLPADGTLLVAAGSPVGAMAMHPLSSQFTGQTMPRLDVVDVNNGPHPKDVKVTEIIGGRSLRVEFEIEICRKMCVPGIPDIMPDGHGFIPSTGSQVLSNRWHLDESKDENWMTTRVMQGTLRVMHKAYWPHLMRTVCVPKLLRGYKRVRQTYVDDPTGLVLKYRIEDQQAHAAPPWPAVAWKGHHAESAAGDNGLLQIGEFSIKLTGPPGVDKVQLIGAAGKVAVDRIKGLVPVFSEGERTTYKTVLHDATVVNVLDEPVIELRVRARYTGKDDMSYKALALRLKEMGKPLTTLTGIGPYEVEGYDPMVWPVPLPYDSKTPAGIFSCYLQHPCSVWHGMPSGLLPGSIPEPPRPEVAPAEQSDYAHYTSSQELPPEGDYLKPDVTGDASGPSPLSIYDFPYNFVDLQNKYVTLTGWSQLPYADTNPNAEKSALLVQLHGRVTKRVLTMTASRDGQMPMLPSLAEDIVDHNGIREVMESSEIIIKAPQLLAGAAGRRYAVESTYVYLLSRAPKANEKLRGGSTQLDRLPPVKNWIDLAKTGAVDTGGAMQFQAGSGGA